MNNYIIQYKLEDIDKPNQNFITVNNLCNSQYLLSHKVSKKLSKTRWLGRFEYSIIYYNSIFYHTVLNKSYEEYISIQKNK